MAESTLPVSSSTTRTPLVITSFPSIPLTTTFTPSASDCGGIYSGDVLIIDDKPSCLPPRFSTSDSSFFYSPGIACPDGYYTACHDTTGVASITTVTCCPTHGDISLSCVPNPLSLSSVWETLFCTWIAPDSSGTVVTVTKSENGRTSTVTEAVTAPGGINAYGVRMVFEASDLQTSSSSTSDATATGTTPSTTAASSTPGTTTGAPAPATSGDLTTQTSDSGLSTGAKAAIGVVVPLVVLGALAAALFFWLRRRRATTAAGAAAGAAEEQSPPFAPTQQYGAAPTTAGVGEQHKHYYTAAPPQEVPGTWPVTEMPSTRAAAELPGEPMAGYGR